MSTILGFKSNDKLGILNAFSLKFDKNNRLTKLKGASGEGKTTAMDALKMCLHGQKILKDKHLRGILDIETQILDGEHNLFVGYRPDGEGSYESYLYEKDSSGKKKNNPTIDGEQCTPSAWQKLMTNELTWNYDGFTSKSPADHKNTLLKLFQSHLKDAGVVFDKKSSMYNDTILDKIDKAVEARSYADMKRKESGGIAEDLKEKHGIDVNRPATNPIRIPLSSFDEKTATINKSLGNLEADKKQKLQDIKLKASELEKKAMLFNDRVEIENKNITIAEEKYKQINDHATRLSEMCSEYVTVNINFGEFPKIEKRQSPITLSNGKISLYDGVDKEAIEIMETRERLVNDYKRIDSDPLSDEKYKIDLEKIEKEKEKAIANNRVCDAVDLYKDWAEKDGEVKGLKNEYLNLLTSIDIGVEGMKIFPEEGKDDQIFLKYNGCHDPEYFHNKTGEYRKLNEYSGTQMPMIVLLLQNKLLEKRPRALRYIFIDNIPIDKKTQKYLDKMCEELNLWVFVNINGDFEVKQLQDGEVLFEGGEILAANANMIGEVGEPSEVIVKKVKKETTKEIEKESGEESEFDLF